MRGRDHERAARSAKKRGCEGRERERTTKGQRGRRGRVLHSRGRGEGGSSRAGDATGKMQYGRSKEKERKGGGERPLIEHIRAAGFKASAGDNSKGEQERMKERL
jgi:hypothetical protein